MSEIKERMESVLKLISDITDTAREVNRESHTRKDNTSKGLVIIDKLLDINKLLVSDFENIFNNLNEANSGIEKISAKFKSNIELITAIIGIMNKIKSILTSLQDKIMKLQNLVREIKDDTDEIFTLALNASIVSSKYSHTSGVFDILANKLDEMSNFINRNLDSIVQVVKPITDGINKLMGENTVVLENLEKGHSNFLQFPEMLHKQKESIGKLLVNGELTNKKIKHQKKMLEDITEMFVNMDIDANEAITGSGNVIVSSEELGSIAREAITLFDGENDYIEKIKIIHERSVSIRNLAGNVNIKSKSQLEFLLNCLDFCNSIISESEELREIAKNFSMLNLDNNKMVNSISENIADLITQLNLIENRITASNETSKKFNDDYGQIDNIIEFLKNILKSMKIIGMLSRIESSRDPEEFQGFMTISENIGKLQDKIHNNIPLIEDNINLTHDYITDVNNYFETASSDFSNIKDISNDIIDSLKEISQISTDSSNISKKLVDNSGNSDAALEELSDLLNKQKRIVEIPIKGSEKNIERGKKIQEACEYILESAGEVVIKLGEEKEITDENPEDVFPDEELSENGSDNGRVDEQEDQFANDEVDNRYEETVRITDAPVENSGSKN